MLSLRSTRFPRWILVVCFLPLAMVWRSAEADLPAERHTGSLVLSGARIITQGAAEEVTGDLLIKDGKIVQLGRNLTIPADAERIDVRGMVITPGLIDARSTLWLTRAAAGEGAGDGSLNAMDGVDFLAEDWREVARQGVTAVYVQPSPSGSLGGRGVVLRVAPARRREKLVVKEDAGAQASLGIGGRTNTSRDRYSQYEQVKKVLASAKAYGEQRERYKAFEKSQKSKQQDKSGSDDDSSKAASPTGKPASDEKPPENPAPDPTKDFLLTVLRRQVPLHMEVHRADDLRNALQLRKDFNLHMVFEGISNPGTSRNDLLQSRAPLVIGPILELEGTPAYRQQRPEDWISLAREAEGRWALATFGKRPRASRFLRAQAAAAVARGIDSDRVLRSITSDAARILGVDDRLGILAPGRDADLVVFAGQPLDPAAAVRLVISQGEIVYRSDDVQPLVVEPASPPKGLDTRLPAAYAVVAERFMNEGGELAPGRMIVNGGRIVSLASTLDLPEGIPVFDLGGAVVTPGLVSACTDLGLSAAIDQKLDALAAHVRASDAFDPSSTAVRELVRGGFLTIVLASGPANVVGGNVGLLRLGTEQPVLNGEFAVRFNLTAAARTDTRFPGSLAGQSVMIREALSGRVMPLSLFLPQPIRRALAAENERALDAVRQGKRTALFHAESRAELRAALELIEQFELRGVLLHPASIGPLLDDIHRLGIGIVARPAGPDDYDRWADELVAAARKGVPIGFSGHSPDECRLSAALLAAAGVPRPLARALLADVASRAVGAPPGCGKLVEQARADFVVWNGDPLDLRCRPLSVVVNGELVNE